MCGRYSNHVDAMRTWIRILGNISKLHPRMPVIVERRYVHDWFRASLDKAKQLLFIQQPDMAFYEVGPDVNNPRNDGPELIKKVKVIKKDVSQLSLVEEP